MLGEGLFTETGGWIDNLQIEICRVVSCIIVENLRDENSCGKEGQREEARFSLALGCNVVMLLLSWYDAVVYVTVLRN